MLRVVLGLCAVTAGAQIPKPTSKQLGIHGNELTMFVHFSVCTFAGCEHDRQCRAHSPDVFQPEQLDTDQWLDVAESLGAKQVCLTAHHDGG